MQFWCVGWNRDDLHILSALDSCGYDSRWKQADGQPTCNERHKAVGIRTLEGHAWYVFGSPVTGVSASTLEF